MTPILSWAYLPPVAYLSVMSQNENVVLENNGHFQKQTYRNRAKILGANGPLNLIVPLLKRKERTVISEIRISYEENWQKVHWKSFESAYRSSAYFEYYEEHFKGFYDREYRPEYLMEFNKSLLEVILNLLQISCKLEYTKSFVLTPDSRKDLRNIITPKSQIDPSCFPSYPQVFGLSEEDFLANLSVVDLLFNLGPEAGMYLKKISLPF